MHKIAAFIAGLLVTTLTCADVRVRAGVYEENSNAPCWLAFDATIPEGGTFTRKMNGRSLICTVCTISNDGVELTFDVKRHDYIPSADGTDYVEDLEGETMLLHPCSFKYPWEICPEASIELSTKIPMRPYHGLWLVVLADRQ